MEKLSTISNVLSSSTYSVIPTIRLDFLKKVLCNTVTISRKCFVDGITFVDFSLEMLSLVEGGNLIGFSDRMYLIENLGECPVLVVMENPDAYGPGKLKHELEVAITSSPEKALEISNYLKEKYPQKRRAIIDWWFTTKDGPQSVPIAIEKPLSYCDSFYPWIENPQVFIDDYLASSNGLLF